jgi:hypothetical protein
MTDPCPPEKRSPMEHERDDLTPEAVERLARQLAFVANRTGMTISKCEAVTDESAAALRALLARAEAAEAEVARKTHTCPLGEDCDLTVAWMARAAEAKAEAAALRAKLDEAVKALETVAYMGYDAPATFAGSEGEWSLRRASLMQTAARATLARITEGEG